ncbi:rhodanese-like domain-containing protein [Allofranklinella schreckenbergeri]|uniref:Rhodanese-like domain-containing protein n=1 Tax=Allofranklinella schreckenbergeri TaxID=1076744 RepID=A0A3M6QW53_9BURK|nr:rhodanese-like domain-containing protein [Allofranklinella schreckenbergeri]RMW97878.1 rhodanese-like domain-containing protein [Allofranklinella schreckenbergeri]RMW99953.1 rhodanese-like domain-containing protein [Allofranklinella schreckenbergeri]RMX07240.1 rhodanese-like domain-containing protein [Allofranklinella schreckenbergeri]RRD43721.1 rhodanese-like domain-containing protein [Comamonadaceae bacterium OH3737_COT-264]
MMDAAPYAGDITPETAWQWAMAGQAVIIDVRTHAELVWVGQVPGARSVPWSQWPDMAFNADFDAQLRAAAPPDKKILMLCRSGGRSVAAAARAAALGFEAFNILEGFEGSLDRNGHRGTQNGWRYRGLPWIQF